MRGALTLSIFLVFHISTKAVANDLPILGNRAAQEVREIEEGVFAAPPGSKLEKHLFSIFSTSLAWPRNSLKVCFWNGTPDRQEQVSRIADELTADLAIKFAWRGDDGNIVQCPDYADDQGRWSQFDVRVALSANQRLVDENDNMNAFFALVGQQKPKGRRATVNLPFDASSSMAFVRNNVLHEFCHVLGCLHEFQRDICTNNFDETAISLKFSLSPQQYRENFGSIRSSHAFGNTTSSDFDKVSVMMYRFTREMFKAGSVTDCINETPAIVASPKDLAGLEQAYALTDLRMKLDDFKVLSERSRQTARAQTHLAATLRSTNARWLSRNKGLGLEGSAQSLMIDQLAREADERARAAEEEARSYKMTPEIERKVRLALSHLPAQ